MSTKSSLSHHGNSRHSMFELQRAPSAYKDRAESGRYLRDDGDGYVFRHMSHADDDDPEEIEEDQNTVVLGRWIIKFVHKMHQGYRSLVHMISGRGPGEEHIGT